MIVSPTPHDSSTSSDDSSKQKETEKEVNKYCPDMKVRAYIYICLILQLFKLQAPYYIVRIYIDIQEFAVFVLHFT